VAIENKGRSASLSYAGSTYVAPHETIRCLRDQMIVEPLDVEHSQILIVKEDKGVLRGVVKAIGPGTYPNRYDHQDKHKRTKMWKSKHFLPTSVKVGDIVELGMADGRGYSWQSFMWGSKIHIICRELDIAGVECGEPDGFGDNLTSWQPRDQPTPLREGQHADSQTR